MAREKYDWDTLKARYVAGSYKNLRDFSEREGINYDVLRRKASKWHAEKSQASHTKVTKIVTKTIEKIADREADRNARHVAILDKILDKVEKVIDDELNSINSKAGDVLKTELIQINKLDVVIKVLEKAQKGHRLALGLDKAGEANKETKVEISLFDPEQRRILLEEALRDKSG